jgi:RHS repeat-associated protein
MQADSDARQLERARRFRTAGDYTAANGDVWMGARWYRPGTGTFLHRDTVFGQLQTPISLNRYTYANGSPLNMWDPDGREAEETTCNRDVSDDSDTDFQAWVDAYAGAGGHAGCIGQRSGTVVQDVTTWGATTFAQAAGTLLCGTAAAVVTKNPAAVGAAGATCGGIAARTVNTLVTGGTVSEALSAGFDLKAVAVDAGSGAASGAATRAFGASPTSTVTRKAATEAVSNTVAGGTADAAKALLDGKGANAALAAFFDPAARGQDFVVGGVSGLVGSRADDSRQSGRTRLERDGGPACVRHSFASDTDVVMADGSRRDIAEVELGEWVLATDPVSGETVAREVTRLWVHDDRELVDVLVATDEGVERLSTTAWHPFFSESRGVFVDAEDLVAGERLWTDDGDVATVFEVQRRAGVQRMFDLTVDVTHTYYVVAGDQPVLVHNCGNTTPGAPAATKFIDDDVVLVRGGLNQPENFAGGTGVVTHADGTLSDVSVFSGTSVEDAVRNSPIKNGQVGSATAGDVRRAGGTVDPTPTANWPNHCSISGLSASALSELFTPTVNNPCR